MGCPTLGLIKRVVCGALAGYTTMVANVGGPVTAIFFLSEKLSVLDFLGTTAWFYLIVNLVKLPFSICLDMITPQLAFSIVWIAPVIILAVVAGRAIAKHVDKGAFTVLVYVLSIAAVVKLFL